jgi:hypothetical protein
MAVTMPPDKETPQGRHSPGDATTTSRQQVAGTCEFNGVGRQWRRRREAALRMPVLDCGCRDPWHPCTCSQSPLSEKMVDAGAQAARHLLEVGFVPLLEVDTLRALHRRGGADRRLAQELYELVGGDGA